MMRLSKSEDYAVLLVHALAKEHKKRLVPLSTVAKKYKISLLFLRNLANDLRHAGIIGAVEGKAGGYFLISDPRTVTIGEILQALSKKQPLLCCPIGREHKGNCPIHVLRKMNQEFVDKISNLTIEEFVG